jgi:phosphoribosyl-AMP cyclohydrolase
MAPVATLIQPTPTQLAAVTYNSDGLVPAVVQDHATGDVLMMAWMDEDALLETLATGRMVYWSRSRQERWRKGDTSGERQWVRSARYDCDGDALLFSVEQEGRGACHTGARSCFYRAFGDGGSPTGEPRGRPASGESGPRQGAGPPRRGGQPGARGRQR